MSLDVGDLVYYTGDMANRSGWFRIVRVLDATKYAPRRYDLDELGGGEDRAFPSVYAGGIGEVYKGHCGTRFVTEDAAHAWRAERMAAASREP